MEANSVDTCSKMQFLKLSTQLKVAPLLIVKKQINDLLPEYLGLLDLRE